MTDAEEWLTVPQAARRLGIGDRQAYRHAGKLSDDDVKASDTGQRLVRLSALARQTGVTVRQTGGTEEGQQQKQGASDITSDNTLQPSDITVNLSDRMTDTLSDSVSDIAAVENLRRELQQSEKDRLRAEDENRFMREQLALAMSGWREEQRRSKDLAQQLKQLPAPGEPADTPQPDADTPAVQQTPESVVTADGKRPGLFARIWKAIKD